VAGSRITISGVESGLAELYRATESIGIPKWEVDKQIVPLIQEAVDNLLGTERDKAIALSEARLQEQIVQLQERQKALERLKTKKK
jgi:hypothetical protein